MMDFSRLDAGMPVGDRGDYVRLVNACMGFRRSEVRILSPRLPRPYHPRESSLAGCRLRWFLHLEGTGRFFFIDSRRGHPLHSPAHRRLGIPRDAAGNRGRRSDKLPPEGWDSRTLGHDGRWSAGSGDDPRKKR